MELKQKYDLVYLVHNYFPPPKEEFVLNLGSTNNEIIRKSISLCKKAIDDAVVLGAPCYSIHAGFYFDPEIPEFRVGVYISSSYVVISYKTIFHLNSTFLAVAKRLHICGIRNRYYNIRF